MECSLQQQINVCTKENRLLKAMSSGDLNISQSGNSITSLSNLFQCLTVHKIKKKKLFKGSFVFPFFAYYLCSFHWLPPKTAWLNPFYFLRCGIYKYLSDVCAFNLQAQRSQRSQPLLVGDASMP